MADDRSSLEKDGPLAFEIDTVPMSLMLSAPGLRASTQDSRLPLRLRSSHPLPEAPACGAGGPRLPEQTVPGGWTAPAVGYIGMP